MLKKIGFVLVGIVLLVGPSTFDKVGKIYQFIFG
jgi:hypothetical protein